MSIPFPLPDGTLLKGSGPEVYRVSAGARRWVPDPHTLLCIGSWAAVLTVPDTWLTAIPRGPDLPSRANGTLLKGTGPKVYVVQGCRRCWVPRATTC